MVGYIDSVGTYVIEYPKNEAIVLFFVATILAITK
jgi:hypothetical protein